jgi:hypothetical protein
MDLSVQRDKDPASVCVRNLSETECNPNPTAN